jgi:tRNA(Ile)-lysidine synthase
VVVAVSGGGDSVGLLRALHDIRAEFDLRLSVAHLDHGTRGEEGQGDARFVAELAQSLGLPFDLGHWRASRAGHFEADARRGRYEWLTGVAKDRGASSVAVGQTLDDQAETILHRIVRGTGLRGLSGMPGRRTLAPGVVLVRPLLGVSRAEVRAYLDAIGQGFREDSTNRDTTRTRSRIRLELLPELAEKYNPGVAGALVRLGRIALDSTRSLERLALGRLLGLVLESGPDRVVLDRPALEELAPFERVEVLRLAWRGSGWPEGSMDARRWRRLAKLDRSRVSVGAGVEATLTADRLTLCRSNLPPGPPRREPVALALPGWSSWEGGRIGTTLDPDDPRDESVDLDALALPLIVRQPEPGDRFEPLGMEGRSQSLNDCFRGRRVPRTCRASVPIVCDRAGIVWVVGHRIAHRARLTGETRRTLGLRFDSDPPG